MDREAVVKILAHFRDVEKEIKFCNRVIDELNAEYYDMRSPTLDGTRRSSEVSDPTSRIAIETPDSVSQTMRQMTERIASLCSFKREVYAELEKLTYIQKAVVYAFYVERKSWTQISFCEHYSVPTCKRVRKKAIANLREIFVGNKAIQKFYAQNEN